MSLFNRKNKKNESQNMDDVNANDFINEINAANLSDNDLKKIHQSVDDASISDEIPSANTDERDTGNAKKLKMIGAMIAGMLIVLIGLGATIGRYQAKKDAEKTKQAEEAAANQKKMANGNGIDIAKDQEAIAASNFKDIPPPAAATEPTNEPINTGMPPASSYHEPIEPPVEIKTSSKYANDEGAVAGRDYSKPAPIPSLSESINPPSMTNNVNPPDPVPATALEAPSVMIPPPKGADSDVMVNVATRAVTATSSNSEKQEGKLAASLKPTVLVDTAAGRRGDATMLMMKGTTIPCVLKTKIDSTYQGFTICQISKDVYSSNGKTLLIERGSSVFGEQNVELQQGQARVAVLWTKVETPKGVSINIDSPATGSLGQMGIGAKVNNHFWKRFGGSIMLSIIQDGLAAAQKKAEGSSANGDNNTTINSTSNTAQSMAEKALDNTINIPPTATVKPGTVLNIMVVRDIDFSTVYKLNRR